MDATKFSVLEEYRSAKNVPEKKTLRKFLSKFNWIKILGHLNIIIIINFSKV